MGLTIEVAKESKPRGFYDNKTAMLVGVAICSGIGYVYGKTKGNPMLWSVLGGVAFGAAFIISRELHKNDDKYYYKNK